MKRVLSLVLAMVLCISMIGTAFAAEITFTDVKPSDWFYSDVKSAVELGLINGKSATRYAPNDNLTYAEALKLAACMHQLSEEGSITLKNGNPWYQSYVDYCMKNGIIPESANYQYNAPATREGYMHIFAHALPESKLPAINDVPMDSIPDYHGGNYYAKEIYQLYRAGILQGVDAAHNCNPKSNIKRSEVAAILTRMMDASKRVKFSMGTSTEPGEDPGTESGGGSGGGGGGGTTPPATDPLAIKVQPTNRNATVGDTVGVGVSATGGKAPYTYQWQVEVTLGGSKGWFNIEEDNSYFSDEDTKTLSVTSNTKTSKKVRCIVTDANGDKVTSKDATVDFVEAAVPLSVSVAAQSVTAAIDDVTTLSVTVQGGKAPYTYTWEIGVGTETWTKLSDNPFFTDTDTEALDVTFPEATVEKFHCVVTDANGDKVTSDIITLTVSAPVAEPLAIKTQPVATEIEIGDSDSLSVEVTGGVAPYTYQWQLSSNGSNFINASNNAAISGAKTEEITLNASAEGTSYFRCVITDAKGVKVTSKAVKVIVKAAGVDVKFAVEGLDVASSGVILWGKIKAGEIKEGDTLYLNSADNKCLATFTVVKLEKNRGLVGSVDAASAGDATIGILTDLDKTKWPKGTDVSGCVISTKKGLPLLIRH